MMEKYALLKVMKEVLGNASSRYSVTQAAKKSGVSIFAAKHSLDELYLKGIISLEKIGRTYQYQANLSSYLTRQWKITFTIEDVAKAKLVERIRKRSKSISSMVLYGSAAIGKDDQYSDFDVLVIADVSSEVKRTILAEASGTRREANIQVYTPIEWKRKANMDKAFYETVIIDSIVLYGEKPVVL